MEHHRENRSVENRMHAANFPFGAVGDYLNIQSMATGVWTFVLPALGTFYRKYDSRLSC